MKYNILKASVIYGGGPSGPTFNTIHKDVSQDFVLGYFENIKLESNFRTKEDSMGCYTIYKIEVSKLGD